MNSKFPFRLYVCTEVPEFCRTHLLSAMKLVAIPKSVPLERSNACCFNSQLTCKSSASFRGLIY